MPASTPPTAIAMTATTRSCDERNNAGGNTGFAARFSTDQSSGTPIAMSARHGQTRTDCRLAAQALVSIWPIPITTAASTDASTAAPSRIETPRFAGDR